MLSGTESRTFRGKKKGEKKGTSPPHTLGVIIIVAWEKEEQTWMLRGSKSGKNGKKNKN